MGGGACCEAPDEPTTVVGGTSEAPPTLLSFTVRLDTCSYTVPAHHQPARYTTSALALTLLLSWLSWTSKASPQSSSRPDIFNECQYPRRSGGPNRSLLTLTPTPRTTRGPGISIFPVRFPEIFRPECLVLPCSKDDRRWIFPRKLVMACIRRWTTSTLNSAHHGLSCRRR